MIIKNMRLYGRGASLADKYIDTPDGLHEFNLMDSCRLLELCLKDDGQRILLPQMEKELFKYYSNNSYFNNSIETIIDDHKQIGISSYKLEDKIIIY